MFQHKNRTKAPTSSTMDPCPWSNVGLKGGCEVVKPQLSHRHGQRHLGIFPVRCAGSIELRFLG